MIARRKRMLQTFLNRLARHPILSNDHVFHRFLDGEVSWVRTAIFRGVNLCSYSTIGGNPKFATLVSPPEKRP